MADQIKWYVVDSRRPWVKLKVVSAVAKSRKVAWIEIPSANGKIKKQFIGQTVFKDHAIALRDQISRCNRMLKVVGYGIPIIDVKTIIDQCKIRILLCEEYLRKD